MEIPSFISLSKQNKKILTSDFLSGYPNEVCGLLIGCVVKVKTHEKLSFFKIKNIWKCENIWKKEKDFDATYSLSKRNRFLIKPEDHISAQKWSREKNLKILGTYHSHPFSHPIPSQIDIRSVYEYQLTIICSQNNEIKAWWIANESANELKINYHQ